MKESGYEELPFKGKYNLDIDYLKVVNDIKQTLGLQQNWASKHPTWERTLNFLIYKIEEAGIITRFMKEQLLQS